MWQTERFERKFPLRGLARPRYAVCLLIPLAANLPLVAFLHGSSDSVVIPREGIFAGAIYFFDPIWLLSQALYPNLADRGSFESQSCDKKLSAATSCASCAADLPQFTPASWPTKRNQCPVSWVVAHPCRTSPASRSTSKIAPDVRFEQAIAKPATGKIALRSRSYWQAFILMRERPETNLHVMRSRDMGEHPGWT